MTISNCPTTRWTETAGAATAATAAMKWGAYCLSQTEMFFTRFALVFILWFVAESCSNVGKLKDDKDDSKGEPDKENDTEKSAKALEESSPKEETPEADKGEEELVEVEDDDDYLLYLEVILRTIHTAYYDLYDQMREEKRSSPSTSSSSLSSSVPDLKTVIPYVKRKVQLSCQIFVHTIQGCAKKFLLSLVRKLPLRLMGCALAAQVSGQM